MTAPSFTPGPWVVTTETRMHVAVKSGLLCKASEFMTPANAALIAAAPDLYAALVAALDDDLNWVRIANAAILKAISLPEVAA